MKVYKVDVGADRPDDDRMPFYAGTVARAHDLVRNGRVPKSFWADTTITELNVQSDKEGMLAALNGSPVFLPSNGRVWGITPRGGLKEER